ncbi:hypothetical protein PLANPX_5240 [Lacipirellula parvula]|uniref:PEP-CTERM protein-sorting domain-containing protein n=1 Tax=Lacipirellula parvula TaxID=2650471 RepID=A0A5K7XGQ4_9BACT|nr:hypothetical protein PLANPX_5240 [Lacipirellula parvula]
MLCVNLVLARRLGCATLLSWALAPNASEAATITYANPAGAQNFTVGANWVGGVAPGSGDLPTINGVNGAVNYPYVSSAVAVQRFLIGDQAADSGGLEIRTGGTLTTSLTSAHYVGARGTGIMTIQPGATANVNGPLNIGWGDTAAHGTGTVNQLGGAYNGTGASGGLILGVSAAAGPLAASVGTYNMQAGTMNIGSSLVVGQAGIGTFNMSGGSVATGNFLQIGRTGTGTFTQTAGSLTVNRASGDTMVIGAAAGGVGKYEISGGSLSVTTTTGPAVVANGIAAGTASGTFKIVGNGATSIAIAGDYKQYVGSNLELTIGAGITPIAMTGSATLGGALNALFSSSPSIGQQFTVMTYGGSLTGTFGTFDNVVDGPLGPNTITLSLDYGTGANSAVVLTVVPEPATGALVACGAIVAALSCRRGVLARK